ncbi:MAG: hypothetical protein WD876_03365, partial [Candidatus Pacearchaeota archaeon]
QSGCQEKEYEISCDKDFTTGTLFREASSPTVYISSGVNSASSEGTTTETVNSLCFADGSSCSYEGTLWASLALSFMGEDISPYVPYLVVLADTNPRTLPEAFLSIILGESYVNRLLAKQKNSQYWETSNDRYYDTALALLALRPDISTQKTNALDWLEETQGSDGCWKNSVKNTAFILYSISPKSATGNETTITKPFCETAGYSCIYPASCTSAGGNILDNYQCSSGLGCCDKKPEVLTCFNQGGEVCSSNKECIGGAEVPASDVSGSSSCCVRGICIERKNNGEIGGTEGNTCETNLGVCRSSECNSGEEAVSLYSCDSLSQVCCFAKKSGSYLWIWILVILIILTATAIFFRDKLRTFWLYLKTKFGGNKPGPSSGTHSPPFFPSPVRRFVPRRILPPSTPNHYRPTPARRHSGELDDVLKKLKDMSK